MTRKKFNLTWNSYTQHFHNVLAKLFSSSELSDVTLVCDDQVKFKAHRFILKECSPVFKSILEELDQSKPVIYLRGINHLELKPILEFMYCGKASFYQERMKEFIKVGKDLQVKEISDVPTEDDKIDQGNVTHGNETEENQEDYLSDGEIAEYEDNSELMSEILLTVRMMK